MRLFARSERLTDAGARSAPLQILLLMGLCVSRAHAEEFEQHHAHEHGKVALNVAIDASTLSRDACRACARPPDLRTGSERATFSINKQPHTLWPTRCTDSPSPAESTIINGA
jgi:hypothetical protein